MMASPSPTIHHNKQTNKLYDATMHSRSPNGEYKVAGLDCSKYGGPTDPSEMVYWRDIPQDTEFMSPFTPKQDEEKYVTFEPDEGGFNNICMALETVITMALLDQYGNNSTQKNRLSFNDFYPLEAVARENKGLKLMSMEDILQQTDFFVDRTTGEPLTPPQNRTDWNGVSKVDIWELHRWLRSVGSTPYWSHKKCIVDFSPDLQRESYPMSRRSRNQPTPVNGSSTLRLAEVLAHRTKVCMYDREWQAVKVIHFTVDNASGTRLLIHFYAFLFSSDWTMDLWIKRFARDHLRYVDEIQCAAARIVAELRRLSPNNAFDTFHIRRGDFKGWVRLSANEIYSNIEDVLTPNSSIYIATDEMNRSYFEPFFAAAPSLLLERLSTPDTRSQHQLPRSRRTTRCCSWSPLRRVLFFHLFQFCESTARRYYSTRDKLPGYAEGTLPTSYYYAPLRKKNAMHSYKRLSRPFNGREFPVAWKNIDLNLESNVSTTVAKN